MTNKQKTNKLKAILEFVTIIEDVVIPYLYKKTGEWYCLDAWYPEMNRIDFANEYFLEQHKKVVSLTFDGLIGSVEETIAYLEQHFKAKEEEARLLAASEQERRDKILQDVIETMKSEEFQTYLKLREKYHDIVEEV